MGRIKIKTLEGKEKKIALDENYTVGQLMVKICKDIGLPNHLGYSLAREITDDEIEKMQKFHTGTMEEKERSQRQIKEKQLKRLDHLQTLKEQGVEDTHTLVVQHSLFFLNQNVEFLDPDHRKMLYEQSRDAILDNLLPVNEEEAIQLAGLQTHIQFGDYKEKKSTFLKLTECLPAEYVNKTDISKRIIAEYKKWIGFSDLDAEYKYAKKCRGLKTYGFTFFFVEENLPGKENLEPRYLGIKKESIINVDVKTKEILNTWPLTTVKRWATSSYGFHLDFGDYSRSHYKVKTNKGQQIARLITSYTEDISIQKKGRDRVGSGRSESTPKSTITKTREGYIRREHYEFAAALGEEQVPEETESQDDVASVHQGEEKQGDIEDLDWNMNPLYVPLSSLKCDICCRCQRLPSHTCRICSYNLCEICVKIHLFDESKDHEVKVVKLFAGV